jgi:hypothetical protein
MGTFLIKLTVFCAAIAVPILAAAGSIQQPYGLTFVDFGSTGSLSAPGTNIQNAQQTSASDSFDLNQGGGISNFSASISDAQIHLYSQTVAGPPAGCCFVEAGADLYWFDTFTFRRAPTT